MTRFFTNSVAAVAAVFLMTASMTAVISIPSIEASVNMVPVLV